MKRILIQLYRFILWFAFLFRYRIHIKGLEKINPKNQNKTGGTLFLANHAAVFIDPAMIMMSIFKKTTARPLVVDYMYETPVVHSIMKTIEAVPIPDFDFSSNQLKIKQSEKVIGYIGECLKKGDNFLIYPAARTKSTSLEEIGGSSGVYQLLKDVPEANIVFVRIAGLWGSSFSRSYTGTPPSLFKMVLRGIKVVFKNLIFFTPKRDVYITFEPAPADFPYSGTKKEINRYMENWFNLPDGLTKQEGEYPGDSLVRVSYSRWRTELIEPYNIDSLQQSQVDLSKVPDKTKQRVYKYIAELSNHAIEEMKPELHLHKDLGLDSLDAAQIALFLHQEFKVPMPPVMQLQTVLTALGVASKQINLEIKETEKEIDFTKWVIPQGHERVTVEKGDTIIEVFLNTCQKRMHQVAVADRVVGILKYEKFLLAVILFANYIKTLPGKYVGIMLPASAGAYLLVLATMLAGKVPLMVNWTIGRKHLEAMANISKVDVVLSSMKFIDRLGNVELQGIDEKLILLEDVRKKITLMDKLKALFLSKSKPKDLMKKMGIENLTKDDQAVLLFTSGTESLPKGVPLTHENILSNLRGGLEVIEVYKDDVFLGILPPFHSFGFTVSGLLPLLTGVVAAFSPNPLDGSKIARDFADFKATVIMGAPVFIRALINSSEPAMLKTLRLCISGAEAAPPELFKELEKIGKISCLVEGYGITECSPILTGNHLGKPSNGVGWPLPNLKLKIVHHETLKEIPQGETGMILANGPNVFSGYINPGLESPFIEIDGEKWFKTGDLGYLDPEGRLVISGRLKRFIKLGGEMISLNAMEHAVIQIALNKNWLVTGMEGNAVVAVCAKEVPGEKAKIYLMTVFEIGLEEINDALRNAGFGPLMKFTKVIHLDSIPILGTGKINYRSLSDIMEKNLD